MVIVVADEKNRENRSQPFIRYNPKSLPGGEIVRGTKR